MNDALDLTKLKMNPKTTLKASDIRIHDFDVGTVPKTRAATDILERFNRAASQAVQASASSLAVSAVDVDFDSLQIDFGDQGPESKALREAKRLIGEKKFEDALTPLAEVLRIAPGHHEATYLRAYCEHQLKRSRQALKTLLELNNAPLTNRLQTKVRVLREEIRAQMLPRAARIFADVAKSREPGNSVAELLEFLDVDPGMGKYHYFLAGVLIVGKQMVEAQQAIEHGLKVCDTGHDDLNQLKSELEFRMIPQLLHPARKQYRAKQHRAALNELEKLPTGIREAPMFKAFYELVGGQSGQGSGGGLFSRLLGGGIKSNSAIHCTPERRDLYEYLLEPEMKKAREAYEQKKYAEAERELTRAIDIIPNFSVSNFLLATSVYQRVSNKVQAKIGTDLDEASAAELSKAASTLANVRKNAEIGSRDSALPDAKRLVKSIDEMCNQIESVVQTHEDQVHDAKIVNELIDQFIKLLIELMTFNTTVQALVNSGNVYQIRQSAEDLYGKLSSTRSNLDSLRRRCKGDKAREIIDLVRDKFVEPNYRALKQAMGR